jgi:hypothetical protein
VRDPKERLRDILEGIGNIERYAARGRQALESDELISELVRAAPPDYRGSGTRAGARAS